MLLSLLTPELLLAEILGVCILLVWVFFWVPNFRKETGKNLIILAAGALSTLVYLPLSLFTDFEFPSERSELISYFLYAGSEEILKFTIALAFYKYSRDLRIFLTSLILVSLGFALAENVLFIAVDQSSRLQDAVAFTLTRLIGPTNLHILTTTLVGLLFYINRDQPRILLLGITSFGLVIATCIHTAFNYSLLYFVLPNILGTNILLLGFLCILFYKFVKLSIDEVVFRAALFLLIIGIILLAWRLVVIN